MVRKWPSMPFRTYLMKYADQVDGLGNFFCRLCNKWIGKQKWAHFKRYHRYQDKEELKKIKEEIKKQQKLSIHEK